MRHLLALRELSPQEITDLLDLAELSAVAGRGEQLSGTTLATLFYEPSTRTEISFELAARKLGGGVVRCDVDRSSVQKGESLVDTVRTLAGLGADAIAIRHPSAGAAHLAAAHVRCAVINAGDGMHEHPTQGLLDLLTVRRAKGRIAGLRIAVVGDIRHSRVARSAAWGFSKLGASVVAVGPATLLPTPGDGLPLHLTTSLRVGLEGADVVMVLRMQRERQAGGDVPTLAEYTRGWGVNSQVLRAARPDAILMHPGPANLGIELTADAAYGPQSRIAAQVAAGVDVRMAVLAWALGRERLLRPSLARRRDRRKTFVANGLLEFDQSRTQTPLAEPASTIRND
ncbi:MAG TPA: aspartate carbamoyltransferase catalytic subunit [bacterium]|nr:aspartate carbamoyltransferase catalytic subunit [bacterium]